MLFLDLKAFLYILSFYGRENPHFSQNQGGGDPHRFRGARFSTEGDTRRGRVPIREPPVIPATPGRVGTSKGRDPLARAAVQGALVRGRETR